MKNNVMFKIGDLVEVLDDTIRGTIISIKDASITIESTDGFPITYEANELIQVSEGIQVSNYDIAKIKKEKELPKKRTANTIKIKDRNAPKMEVDLHIHQLTKSSKGMSNHEMLTLQLDAAKGQLEFAIRKRIQKVVFIHGVGEGILKEELQYLFGRYENLKYYDADYQKYGAGATEVYIYQNG